MELDFTSMTSNRRFGKALDRTSTAFSALLDPLTKALASRDADFDVLQVVAIDAAEDYLRLDERFAPRQLPLTPGDQTSHQPRVYQVHVGMVPGLSLKPADDRDFIDAAARQISRAINAVTLPDGLRKELLAAVERARAEYCALLR